jgi:hypothetical protein
MDVSVKAVDPISFENKLVPSLDSEVEGHCFVPCTETNSAEFLQ